MNGHRELQVSSIDEHFRLNMQRKFNSTIRRLESCKRQSKQLQQDIRLWEHQKTERTRVFNLKGALGRVVLSEVLSLEDDRARQQDEMRLSSIEQRIRLGLGSYSIAKGRRQDKQRGGISRAQSRNDLQALPEFAFNLSKQVRRSRP
jgi:hypothetical protein